MATIQGFRVQVRDRVRIIVHGKFPGLVGNLAYRQSSSSFSDEVVGPSRGTLITLNTDSDQFTVFPSNFEDFSASLPGTFLPGQEMISSIQPGQKIFQMRVWAIEEDEGTNVTMLSAGVEIVVHRKLLFQDEESHYVGDEMLDDQTRLLDRSAWRALTSVHSLLEGPSIDSAPEKVDNIMKYTVELQASINP